jgi:predicted RNase H-like HicB family nuclease
MNRSFQIVLEWDSDDRVWVTHVPALDDLSTFGETREEALEQTRDAILGYLEAAAKEGIEVPDSASAVELVQLDVAV